MDVQIVSVPDDPMLAGGAEYTKALTSVAGRLLASFLGNRDGSPEITFACDA